jgi:hypothetical protein
MNGRPSYFWILFVFLTGFAGLITYIIVVNDSIVSAAKRNLGWSRSEKLSTEIMKDMKKENPGNEFSILPDSIVTSPGYEDKDLHALINSGRMQDARNYLDKMYKLAEEMGDSSLKNKYQWYENKLEREQDLIDLSGG